MALRLLSALLCGTIFGFGLALSGMLDPARVRGFLDIGGAFDPSLAFVLCGAVAVSMLGIFLARALRHPAFDTSFHLPQKVGIDPPLIIGAGIFGIGWGLGGFCPGPAIASLALGLVPAMVFTAAMLIGTLAYDHLLHKQVQQSESRGVEAEAVDAQV
jgi:uncharacterized membrane protein YedE/YeeE